MRYILSLFLCAGAMASEPTSLGNYKGLLFNGPSLYQEMTFTGGTFKECTDKSGSEIEIYSCKIEGSSLKLKESNSSSSSEIYFETGAVMQNKGAKYLHHYYKGHRLIEIAGRQVNQPISLILVVNTEDADKLTGSIKLIEGVNTRNGFEAYLVK